MTRRLLDASVAAGGLLFLSVPMALAAAAVRLTSPGPVLYRQERIGRYGRPFQFYKFRTMRADAAGAHVTIATDSRVTGVGRFLRRFKLDELPQLWNIVVGDMALIGPRPEVRRFVSRYNAEQRRILEVRPGLASRSQLVYPHEADLLNGCHDPEETYAAVLMPRKIAVDLAYEHLRTFWTDLGLVAEVALLVIGVRRRIDRDFCISATGDSASPIAHDRPLHG